LKELYIVGAGGLGREAAETVDQINQKNPQWRLAGFTDDNETMHGSVIDGITVAGGRELLKRLGAEREICAVIAIADARIKRMIAEDLDGFVAWTNIIHPSAIISAHSEMGRGNIIQAFCYAGPDARIGDHCMVNIGSVVGHNVVLEDYASVMCLCNIAGGARLRTGAYLGSSVMIVPGVTVGENAFLCAGCSVFKDVDDGAVMKGNPASRAR
jgi:sugar O-acyltransferase (sialic acid O-acetyltransferase NeuD family)